MEFKPHEIALMALGIAAPTILLVLGFIPGGLSFIGDIALNPRYMPFIFFGGAALLFVVLGYRIYRRIRPAQKKTTPSEETPHVTPTPKFSLRRDKPPEQQG
ncbi:MAG: hypothetical protein IPO30_05050 [Hyphomonadaceae bacterium]|nr:hypothetical protein [Hyphomonadaceae bacterium]MBP9233871.1 hypothetical protein [Hyphomonadaceae bacterium]